MTGALDACEDCQVKGSSVKLFCKRRENLNRERVDCVWSQCGALTHSTDRRPHLFIFSSNNLGQK